MGQTHEEVDHKLEVLDHLPRWAYTEEEWKTEVLDKTHKIEDGIRYELIPIIKEPADELDMLFESLIN